MRLVYLQSFLAACCALLSLVLMLALPVAQADGGALPKHKPKVCTGYSVVGKMEYWGYEFNHICPPHHAYFEGVASQRIDRLGNSSIEGGGSCCPLPAKDILLEETSTAYESCEEGYVATGSFKECEDGKTSECRFKFVCTKVNPRRYMLGPPTSAARWGHRSSLFDSSALLHRADIPAAIRHSFGRRGKYFWLDGSCVGYPFGSLSVAKTNKYCDGRLFRRLLYKGLPGDPPNGTPVTMFPDCDVVQGQYTSDYDCLKF